MTIAVARRMQRVRASDVRELLKLTQRPDIISFAGGLPAPELFPVAEVAAAAARVLASHGAAALQYSTTEGHPPLRARIAERLNRLWGTRYAASQVLVTAGSQQGLDLVAKLLIDPGDEVLCESPTYVGAISGFNVLEPSWVEVPSDEDGMDPDALRRLLAACRRPKLIYVVPNFQNPSGRTWSLERRRQVAEIAADAGLPVVDDNPYGELRFEGEPLPSFAALGTGATVIGLGTFSKILSPGLRLAWVAADEDVVAKLALLKQGADLHTATLNQMLVADLLEHVDLAPQLRRITDAYRVRRDAMVRALAREMPAGVRFSRPSGGLFLWLELPKGVDARELLRRCIERGVAFVAGEGFFPNGGHANTARLNFSCMPVDRIEDGVRRIGDALRDLLAESAGSDVEIGAATA